MGGGILYGGNATSGVINIVTKEYENKKYWGGIGLKAGSFNQRKYDLNYGMKLSDKLLMDMKYIQNNKDGYRDYSKRDLKFGEISFKYLLKNGDVGFKYIRNERKSTGASYLTKKEYDENRKQNDSYRGKEAINKQNRYILNFNKEIIEKLKISTIFEYRTRKYTYSYPDKQTGVQFTPAYTGRKKDTNSIYTNVQLKYLYYDTSSLILGGDYQKADVKEDYYSKYKKTPVLNQPYYKSYTNTDYEAIGGYIINKYNYNKFSFTQGIRVEKNSFEEKETSYEHNGIFKNYEKNKDETNNVNYQLTGNYLFTDTFSGYLSWSKVYRSPNLGEYTNWKRNETTGAEESKDAQKVDTFEIGMKSYVNNIYISGAIFYIKGDKEIMYDPYRENDGTRGSYYNLNGKTKRIGLELLSEQMFEKLNIRENFTYLKHEISNGKYQGNNIPGVSNLIFGVGATYTVIPSLLLNIRTNYHGKAYPINDYSNEQSKVSSYVITDISAEYTFSNGISMQIGIDNLFNEIYCDYIIYKDSKNLYQYSPSPERTYYISMKYHF